jgi:branched-chain amino acid transport system substrate-binding protein
MSLALDAIERSGTGERADILEALFSTQDRQSVLGTYSIDENGDTTLTDYGVYSVKDGALQFDQTIKAQTG